MFVTRKHLSRRTVLKGMGATMALPLLDAMTPAFGAQGNPKGLPPPDSVRLVCIEMVHGAAGSSEFGFTKNLWAPAVAGRDFDLGPTSLKPLEPFRDYLTIVSNTDVPSANATEAREIGGDHFRSTAVFLTQSYPKRTEGADVEVGISFDQLYAKRFGQDTAVPSMQVSIESVDEGGGCQYGYSCAYVDSLSWASPHKPLPMARDPRVVFDQLFGMFKKEGTSAERNERLTENRSLLDWLQASSARLRSRLGATDRARLDEYLENVRELERRIQKVEAFNRSGEERELPGAPAGVPDSYTEHVKLMFDLQLLAFTSDVTRVFSFKLSRDGSNRVFPESGFGGPFHNSSHHSAREARILDFAKINTYHVGLLSYFLEKLRNTPDGGSNLLENSLVMYGSPMGDPNFHNHKRVPFILAGHAGGALKGGVHYKAPNRTPLSNVMLGLLHSLGLDDLKTFGDSEGVFAVS
jgi:hypothetical protein